MGLSTVRFRSAQFSSHEVRRLTYLVRAFSPIAWCQSTEMPNCLVRPQVFIPPEQIEWLDQLLTEHPESDGWKGKTDFTTRVRVPRSLYYRRSPLEADCS